MTKSRKKIENNSLTMVKPNPLIEIKDKHELTAGDHKMYNVLIKNAWDEILEDKTHKIHKKELKGSHNGNERIGDSIERLQTTLVKVETPDSIVRMTLMSFTEENKKKDGYLYYRFDKVLREVISSSEYFTRLEYKVLKDINSKYGLSLYEIIAKKANMKYKQQRYTIDEIRALLGVKPEQYKKFSHLREYVLEKAVKEVKTKSGFHVEYTPIKTGRHYTHIVIKWKITEKREQYLPKKHYGEYGIPAYITELRAEREKEKLITVPQYIIDQIGEEGANMDLYQLEEEFYYMNKGKTIKHVTKAFRGFYEYRKQKMI